ncbi:MAG TPA: hypothetical protein PLU35_08150 [Phycisphaerales bacterium]|nr:hypothetical protein [Phycisphaerales bacterium]
MVQRPARFRFLRVLRALRVQGLLSPQDVPLAATVGVLLALFAACAVAFPGFLSPGVARNLLVGNAVLGLVCVGMTFVIISGGIDLSVGAAIGFSGILIASLVQQGWHPLPTFGVALAIGTAGGAAMGTLIHGFALPPFLVTLAGMFLYRGGALMVSERSITIRHPFHRTFAEWGSGTVPPAVVMFIAAAAAGFVVARCTRFGRDVYALGGGEESARLMGVRVAGVKVRVYAISGLCAALAGVAMTLATGAGNATAGHLAELDAIAAVVIGGTPLSGGAGSMVGTVAGVLIFGLIQEAMPRAGVTNSWWFRIAVGGLLLGFVLLQRGVEGRRGR